MSTEIRRTPFCAIIAVLSEIAVSEDNCEVLQRLRNTWKTVKHPFNRFLKLLAKDNSQMNNSEKSRKNFSKPIVLISVLSFEQNC